MSKKNVALTEKNAFTVLTLQQRQYVEARVQGLGPVAACRALGIGETCASGFERHPKIQAAMRYIVSKGFPEAKDVSKNEVLQGMMDAVQSAATSTELVNAWREIGKLIGAYAPERKVIQYQDVSEQDLRAVPDSELLRLAGSDFVDAEYEEIAEREEAGSVQDGEGAGPGSEDQAGSVSHQGTDAGAAEISREVGGD